MTAPKRPRRLKPGSICRHCGRVGDTGRATSDKLDTLHTLVADALVEELRRQQLTNGARGVSPNLLSVINSFLKLNGIDRPHVIHSQIDELVRAMPDFDALDPH
jgi:hypothetical protein